MCFLSPQTAIGDADEFSISQFVSGASVARKIRKGKIYIWCLCMQRRKKEGGSLAVTIQPTDHHHPLARFALCVTKTTSRWEEALATLIDTTVPIKKQRFVVPMIFFFFPRQKVARGEYYSGCWTRAIRTHLRRLSALLLGRKWEEEERKKNPGAYIYTHTQSPSRVETSL